MIVLLGDIHGNYTRLQRAIEVANKVDATALIQVGDFGLFRGFGMNNEEHFKNAVHASKCPVYFIDGNHDDCSRWTTYTEVSQLYPDIPLYYVPRGTVMELDGLNIAFMGGAGSIDKNIRLSHKMHWDENENIRQSDIDTLRRNAANKRIDFFITHCPPSSVIEENFSPYNKLQFGVGLDWKDPNQDIIENLWRDMDYPYIYSGHMHRKVEGLSHRILDIDELLEIHIIGG